MKSPEQIEESIGLFREGFWGKGEVDRPCVGVVSSDVWLPVKYMRKSLGRRELRASDITGEIAASDYEYCFSQRRVSCDDFMPFCAPWRAVPWLEAICGCGVRYATGSFAARPVAESAESLGDLPIPANRAWLGSMRSELERLGTGLAEDCFLSPTILRGPSDVLAAMRGLTNFYCDLIDSADLLAEAAGRVNKLLLDILDEHFSMVGPKLGGYGHIFGYWAPEKTIVIQEDAMGMAGPEKYREIFRQYNAEVVSCLGDYVLFHLHSTGMGHWRDVVSIPGLGGLEITVEKNGPSLMELLEVLREVVESSRLILYVEGYFDELAGVLKKLPKAGLYLILPDSFVGSNEQFGQLVQGIW